MDNTKSTSMPQEEPDGLLTEYNLQGIAHLLRMLLLAVHEHCYEGGFERVAWAEDVKLKVDTYLTLTACSGSGLPRSRAHVSVLFSVKSLDIDVEKKLQQPHRLREVEEAAVYERGLAPLLGEKLVEWMKQVSLEALVAEWREKPRNEWLDDCCAVTCFRRLAQLIRRAELALSYLENCLAPDYEST